VPSALPWRQCTGHMFLKMGVVSYLQIWSTERNMKISGCDFVVSWVSTNISVEHQHLRTAQHRRRRTLHYFSYNKVLCVYNTSCYFFCNDGTHNIAHWWVPCSQRTPQAIHTFSLYNHYQLGWRNNDPLASTCSHFLRKQNIFNFTVNKEPTQQPVHV
jgi:hypothetical protein